MQGGFIQQFKRDGGGPRLRAIAALRTVVCGIGGSFAASDIRRLFRGLRGVAFRRLRSAPEAAIGTPPALPADGVTPLAAWRLRCSCRREYLKCLYKYRR